MKYILVIDQGTTSSRAIIFNTTGKTIGQAQTEFKQIYPHPGWVEHSPIDILTSVRSVISAALKKAEIKYSEIIGMGITNQRETIVMWDKETGSPIYNAIVWQCRRTQERCDALREYEDIIFEKTGLKLDPYFSASKIEWLLNHVEKAKELLSENRLLVGTIDTYLMWQLSGGKIYKTDYTNASRTMLFNIHKLCWDKQLCELFNIPMDILPSVEQSSSIFGNTAKEILGFAIPICGVAGDQQSALFGQCCFNKGDLKVTYGTGCFLLLNSKESAIQSKSGLVTSLSCQTKNSPSYVLEGSVFIGGALIQWLRDGLQLLKSSNECEALASQVKDTNGVYIVPAFGGLGAPYWNKDAQGIITGITRGCKKEHIIRAALEAISYQVNDVIEAMKKDLPIPLNQIKVDGGASVNSLLMQLQSDVSNQVMIRSENKEATALGACYLVGLCLGIWTQEDLVHMNDKFDLFVPKIDKKQRFRMLQGWKNAIHKSFSKT
ncbi:MAG: glycerol kinase GlpK [Anaeroplasma bactoclasticum]|nr:glycerol kinase GlpK [Anaeroplasma bactoclasticum]MCM1557721.1 glycerol kinase GlpK [Anaeroplasma bactoclasticum]